MFENVIFVSMGSNIGDKFNYLETAANIINDNIYCSVELISSIYETIPYGYKNQDNFFNVALKLTSAYSLKDFYYFTKSIEKNLGRKKGDRWGPREIDIDLLFYNDVVFSDELLTIPHTEILNRDFVLVPLCEIASDVIHPGLNKRICEIELKEIEKTILGKIAKNIRLKIE